MTNKKCVVFDLDDTLYKEIDFLKSAYRYIANFLSKKFQLVEFDELYDLYKQDKSALDIIIENYNLPIDVQDLVYKYRYHIPDLIIDEGNIDVLETLKKSDVKIGLLTDGRSRSQRNKLHALGIEKYFDAIIISEEFGTEKPNEKNYLFFEEYFSECNQFSYIADNIAKDFLQPNLLGWTAICLKDNGQNIHTQEVDVDPSYHPQHMINNLIDSLKILL